MRRPSGEKLGAESMLPISRRGVPPRAEIRYNAPLGSASDFTPYTMLLPSGVKVWAQ